MQEKKTDLDGTQKELDAALAYYQKLKPSCVDAGVSYEDRVARRKEEIESLQEVQASEHNEDAEADFARLARDERRVSNGAEAVR